MPTPTRCLVAAVFVAAVVHAQGIITSRPSEDIQTYGLGALITYVVSKDIGPALIKRMRGSSHKSQQVADLDKAGAVMEEKLSNLSESFESHVVEDRENFAGLRAGLDGQRLQMSKIAEGVARIEGMLQGRP